METLTCQFDRNKCDTNSAILSRTLETTMADSSENESGNSSSSTTKSGKGLSPTELMTEQLEAAVSSPVKRRIDALVAEVNKFNDLEKLLLYLKLPTGVSGFDSNRLKSLHSKAEAKCFAYGHDHFDDTSPSLTVTRIEQTQAFNWIRSHLEECSDTSLPKQEVYEDYRMHCDSACRRVLSPADFGKIMKNVFPQVKARRLGTRGNARYCYSGLRKKCDVQPPLLPAMDRPPCNNGPNDLPPSSSSCKCSQDRLQTDLANTIVICEWAEKIFATHFQTTDELAHHLASNKLVSGSIASFTVLSAGGKDVSSRSLRPDAAMAKLPITPEERKKETQHKLQKKLQQRQLSRMKEEQTRQANERLTALKSADLVKAGKPQRDDRKLLNRSHSMPNEMQMNARTESQIGGLKEQEGVLNGHGCSSRQAEHQGGPTQTSGLQTNNNSNNNSNQLPAAASSTTAAATSVKESPNNKRRFTPIQPKTPVRDGKGKMPQAIPNGPVVLVQPNGAILNAKGQKIQQLPAGVQLVQLSGLPNGCTQQMATIPVQNIPNTKLVALGTTKPSSGSSPGTSGGQNITVYSVPPGQLLKGSPVAGGLLVVNQSPSAGLAASFVNGALAGNTVSVGQGDPTKTLPAQSNGHNVMLQLQSDAAGASPQGGTSAMHSGIVPPLTCSSPLSSIKQDLSSPPIQTIASPACPSSSTVLTSVNPELQKTSPHLSSQLVSTANSVVVGTPTATHLQSPSTSVTFSTLPMRKQISEAQVGMSVAGNHDLNVLSLDGRLASGISSNEQTQMPISNSASALLAMLSNTANKEQGLDDIRAVVKSPRAIPQMGGSGQEVQEVSFASNGTATVSSVSQMNQFHLSATVCGAAEANKDTGEKQLSRLATVSCASLKQPAQTLPTLPSRTHTELASNSGLISILTAPALQTPHMSHQQTSDPKQSHGGSQLISSSGKGLPVYSLPIHTGTQPGDLMAQGIQMPIALDVGNKRLALSSAQYVQPASVIPLQHKTILPQINEVVSEAGEVVCANMLVKQEMENLGSRLIQSTQQAGFVNGSGQGTPSAGVQQQAGIDVQGRQSITPSFNPHSNTATPIPTGMESVPQSPNDPNQVFFTFTPIQQGSEQLGISVTSPTTVKPMQKPKPTMASSQGSFATPSRKRRSSGSARRLSTSGPVSCLPPAVSRQVTPTPSPSGSRSSTPLSPALAPGSNPADAVSMPPPTSGMLLSDVTQPTANRGSTKRDPCPQMLSQASWGISAVGNRKRNPSGPATFMQPAKQLPLDAASFLPDELTDLNIRTYDPNLELSTAQQQYQRSHSVPLPVYQPVVLSQDRFLSNFPGPAEQRGVTVNNRSFGAKRNLTQELQEIQVTDEDFNPEENFLVEGSEAAFSDLLNADLQQPSQGQGSWATDPGLSGIQAECHSDLTVDFPISSCSSEQDADTELGLSQGLADNSNSTTSTLNEEIAAMDDMGSNPVFRDFTLPSWQQIGSNSNLTTLECGM